MGKLSFSITTLPIIFIYLIIGTFSLHNDDNCHRVNCHHNSTFIHYGFERKIFIEKTSVTKIFLEDLLFNTTRKMNIENQSNMSRDQFMVFFRNNETLDKLSVDDRIEIFATILLGSSDFNKELFDSIFSDYCIEHLQILEIQC